jgi:hypothetical protein
MPASSVIVDVGLVFFPNRAEKKVINALLRGLEQGP